MEPNDLWTEHLLEKHECGPYPPERTKPCILEALGERLTLVLPEWLPEIEPVTIAFRDDLVFVLAKIRAPADWGICGNGALLVARRRDDGSYGVHVWHELYEWALGHLVDGHKSGRI